MIFPLSVPDWLKLLWGLLWEAPSPTPYKVCSCGAQYSVEDWSRLEHRGIQVFEEGDKLEALEYRRCRRCQSTLSAEVLIIPR